MDYKELLLSIYQEVENNVSYKKLIDAKYLDNIKIISEKCFVQKGVYTVLVTLSVYKILHPDQDIRNHQTQIEGGFSGRSIDTQFITPTLKKLKLPSMAESGWLTRSLEQPYPYTLNYNGKINNKLVRLAFLELVDAIENQSLNPKYFLSELITRIIKIQKNNKIIITPLENPEKLSIYQITKMLNYQFSKRYNTFGGSKLPVIAFYAIYKIIIKEIGRYKGCILQPIGSHTASDKTSKSSGDIEIYKNNKLFESIEIKLDKPINANIVRIAKEKIIKFNPKRYYILSFHGINKSEIGEIEEIINNVKKNHGCQIVTNGVIPTLKYYLRLISDVGDFINYYSNLIERDSELKLIHKKVWAKLILELQDEL